MTVVYAEIVIDWTFIT